ncbi:uncharacterized protein PHALS_08456 [Plasmopara halstedii]|uniref:Uncharacterized protein n=1 Tax=Plasmopara halstedii TaxID=4781 RepID=A0A0P1ACH1_PLAHL|nr:uncharacterized protein PHALS_08456 [Plasmopara halstedii]CEG38377.1 hypothetical protein PHALS_08456 [Plasmopara halstedii]|eukprot:XP_024574746.1 hypothetical protein PHALS_08456 [Plasmopara halstedii]
MEHNTAQRKPGEIPDWSFKGSSLIVIVRATSQSLQKTSGLTANYAGKYSGEYFGFTSTPTLSDSNFVGQFLEISDPCAVNKKKVLYR